MDNIEKTNKDSQTPITSFEEEETYKEMSPIRLIVRRFFRSKLSIVGLVLIVFLFIFSFFGPLIYSRWGETEVDRTEVVEVIEIPYTYVDEDLSLIHI